MLTRYLAASPVQLVVCTVLREEAEFAAHNNKILHLDKDIKKSMFSYDSL